MLYTCSMSDNVPGIWPWDSSCNPPHNPLGEVILPTFYRKFKVRYAKQLSHCFSLKWLSHPPKPKSQKPLLSSLYWTAPLYCSRKCTVQEAGCQKNCTLISCENSPIVFTIHCFRFFFWELAVLHRKGKFIDFNYQGNVSFHNS